MTAAHHNLKALQLAGSPAGRRLLPHPALPADTITHCGGYPRWVGARLTSCGFMAAPAAS